MKTAEPRILEVLGIGAAEERVYRWLLENPGSSLTQVAQALTMTPGKTQRLLDAIDSKGLTTRAPERPRRYIPVSPDIALRALVAHRQEELRRTETVIRDLQEISGSQQQNRRQDMVELIIGNAAARNMVERILRASQQEVLVLTRPPVLISRLDQPYEREQGYQIKAYARGVRFQSIVDHDFLALPDAVAKVRHDIEAGEEVRVFPNVPTKILICDRQVALIPLNPNGAEGSALLVRSSDLLDALCALFDILWERSVPISFSTAGVMETKDPVSNLNKEAKNLIRLMAAGLNDKKIAAESTISTRTLERRVTALMRSLGTRTRFQTGWFLGLCSSGTAALPEDIVDY
ncbi:MAG: helix-turn-helix domain-containing protein [Gammaproteobacteria bacterium]